MVASKTRRSPAAESCKDPGAIAMIVKGQACTVEKVTSFGDLAARALAKSLLKNGRIEAATRLAAAAGLKLEYL